MPIIKSAIKRMKQTAVRRERNVGIKRDIKTATKAFMAKPSSETLSAVQREFDKAVKKNLLKKNTAARRKAMYARIAKEAGVKLTPAKKATPKATETKAATKKPAAKATATKATTAKKAPAKKTTTTKKPATKKSESTK